MARQECDYYENEQVYDWNNITTAVTSTNGYKAPHNMICLVRGQLSSAGQYYIYPMINGSSGRTTFSGQSAMSYQIAHYFYIRKGDVLKEYQKANLDSVTYWAIQI